MIKNALSLAILVLLSTMLAACSTMLTSKPIAPTVTLESVKPIKLGLRKQELAFHLKISNPNPYDLPLQSLQFIAELDNTEIAQGTNHHRVTLPANGDATVEIRVSTRINKLLGRLLLFASDSTEEMNYGVRGFVKLANWPIKIPFNVDGSIESSVLD